jgi:hypothetical protein
MQPLLLVNFEFASVNGLGLLVVSTSVVHASIVTMRRKFADWSLLFSYILKGMNILLSADEHTLGRTAENSRFRISALAISGKHCKIYRDTALEELRPDEPVPVYLKDTRFLLLLGFALSNNSYILFLN